MTETKGKGQGGLPAGPGRWPRRSPPRRRRPGDGRAASRGLRGHAADTLGWKGTSGGITAQTVLNRVLGNLQPGEIVLMHCGLNPDDHSTLDPAALPSVISALQAPGYPFVTLDAIHGLGYHVLAPRRVHN